MKQKTVMTDRWEGCYDQQWGKTIVPEAMAHPAKYSRGLIERIYRHCLARGYLEKGSLVGDCFGGVGNGGIIAADLGLNWIGVELEPRFVEWANKNFALHAHAWKTMNRPTPRIIQGDSRQFDQLIKGVAGVITSPPFGPVSEGGGIAAAMRGDGDYNVTTIMPRNLYQPSEHGRSKGQIGNLKEGNVSAVISSPPFMDSMLTVDKKFIAQIEKQRNGTRWHIGDYGSSPGQIGKMNGGKVSAVVSSPPYAQSVHDGNGIDQSKLRKKPGKNSQIKSQGYGKADGQIGSLKGGKVARNVEPNSTPQNTIAGLQENEPENYWSACKKVYASLLSAIKSNGV